MGRRHISIIGQTADSIPIMEGVRLEFGKPIDMQYDPTSIHPVLKVIFDRIRSRSLSVKELAKELRSKRSFLGKAWLKRHLDKGRLPHWNLDYATFGALLCLLRTYLKHLPVSLLGSDKVPTEDLYSSWILIGQSCHISLRQVQGGICGTLLQDLRRPLSFCSPQSLLLLKELLSLLSDISQVKGNRKKRLNPWSRLHVLSSFFAVAMLRPHTSNLNDNDCVPRRALVRFLVIHHEVIFTDIVMTLPEDPELLTVMPSYYKCLEALEEVDEVMYPEETSTCASVEVPNDLPLKDRVAQDHEFLSLSEPFFLKDPVANKEQSGFVRSRKQVFLMGSSDTLLKNQKTTMSKNTCIAFWWRIKAWLGIQKSSYQLKKGKCEALKGDKQDKCCVLYNQAHNNVKPFPVEVPMSSGGGDCKLDVQGGTVRMHVMNELGDSPQTDAKEQKKGSGESEAWTLEIVDVIGEDLLRKSACEMYPVSRRIPISDVDTLFRENRALAQKERKSSEVSLLDSSDEDIFSLNESFDDSEETQNTFGTMHKMKIAHYFLPSEEVQKSDAIAEPKEDVMSPTWDMRVFQPTDSMETLDPLDTKGALEDVLLEETHLNPRFLT